MNEEEKSPPSTDDSPKQEAKLNNPSTDEPIAEADQPITHNPPPVTEQDMEVHHHAHDPAAPHHKKNWKSYFWEFLMLFLAVFCGFLAENKREHIIENQREKKYIARIYRDIKKDTAFYSVYQQHLTGMYYKLDSIINLLHTGDYKKEPDAFYTQLLSARVTGYLQYYNAAFDQMKSSGNLRLIHSDKILDSLLNYYYTIEKIAMINNNRYLDVVTEFNNAVTLFWDAGYFESYPLEDGKSPLLLFKTKNAGFPNVPLQNVLAVKNSCFVRKAHLITIRNVTIILKKLSTSLLKLMEEEYHLK